MWNAMENQILQFFPIFEVLKLPGIARKQNQCKGAIYENVLKLQRFSQLRSKKYFDFTPYTDFVRAQFPVA